MPEFPFNKVADHGYFSTNFAKFYFKDIFSVGYLQATNSDI